MTTSDAFALAHSLLRARVSGTRRHRTEDPARPDTVQAMQIALHLPKQQPPRRTDLLEAAARAVAAVCLDEKVATDRDWALGVIGWYDHLIRKVARRARNKAWEDVQQVPGVTVDTGAAQARAFVPSAVSRVPAPVAKLQIRGTDLPVDEPGPVQAGVPLLLVDRDLGMSIGKAAAQVGHAVMQLAAAEEPEEARQWAAAGFPLQVREVDGAEFRRHASRAGVLGVRDAGFTEVDPGSLTVLALPARAL